MIDKIRVVEMSDQVNLHLIHSDKFKTDLIGVYFKRPLNEKEATMNTLLTRILERGTKTWPTSQALNQRLDELYGAILSCDVTKYGELHALQFKIQVPGARHIPQKDILASGVDILNEVINHPSMENGLFTAEIFENEVRNLREEIQGRVNDKMVYAIDRCIETMCENEAFRFHQYGTVEMLDSITLEDLSAHYNEVIKTSPLDIVVVGDIHFDKAESMIKEGFHIERSRIQRIPPSVHESEVREVREVTEHFQVQQAKLTLGFRTNLAFSHPLYNASVIFSNILGGGASSKLFKNVREKASLCYYIFSRIEKYKGILLISSGIEAKDKQKAMDLIEIEIDRMKAGLFDDSDIGIAKDALTSAIRSISDFPNSFMNFYYSQRLSGRSFDLEGLLKKIELVTKEEIVDAARHVVLDTVYFLTQEGEDTNEAL